jgi:hypothetical protein
MARKAAMIEDFASYRRKQLDERQIQIHPRECLLCGCAHLGA